MVGGTPLALRNRMAIIPTGRLRRQSGRATTPMEAVEFAAHLIYGTVTEGLRRLIRRGRRTSPSR
jgi:hypothetical protein